MRFNSSLMYKMSLILEWKRISRLKVVFFLQFQRNYMKYNIATERNTTYIFKNYKYLGAAICKCDRNYSVK